MGDLRNVASDFHLMRGFLHDIDADVFADSVYDSSLLTSSCFSKIVSFFEQPAAMYIIVYLGHGQRGSGDWRMSDGTMSLDDILQLWHARPDHVATPKPALFVYMDSCYSGAWANKAQQLRVADLAIQTSCSDNERAVDGRFTPLWIEFQTGRVPAS